MGSAGRDGGNAGGDLHGEGTACCGAVAELAEGVGAGGPERAIGPDEQRVGLAFVADRDRSDAGGDLHGDRALVSGRAVAELAGAIIAGSPESAVGLDKHGVGVAGRDGRHARRPRRRQGDARRRTAAETELAIVVGAHRPQHAIRFYEQRVGIAGCDDTGNLSGSRGQHEHEARKQTEQVGGEIARMHGMKVGADGGGAKN